MSDSLKELFFIARTQVTGVSTCDFLLIQHPAG